MIRAYIEGDEPVTIPDSNAEHSASLAFKQHQAELAERDNEALQQENATLWRRVEVQRQALAKARKLLVKELYEPIPVPDTEKNEVLRVVRAALTESGETN